MARRVVLVRHGETAWSLSGQHTSFTDLPLTAGGEAQADALAPLLSRFSFVRVISSPRRRALDTARRAGVGDMVEVSDALAEWDYGEYEGRTTAEILADRPGWSLWRDGAPGGEQAADVGARVDRLLAELRQADGDGDVALVGHGHCLRVVGARWIGLAPEDGARLLLPPAGIFVLGHERETPVLVAWSP